jgi:hypothetical protein
MPTTDRIVYPISFIWCLYMLKRGNAFFLIYLYLQLNVLINEIILMTKINEIDLDIYL